MRCHHIFEITGNRIMELVDYKKEATAMISQIAEIRRLL